MTPPHGLPSLCEHRQGRGCEGCRRASVACLLGLWIWITAPYRWIRSLTVEESFCLVLAVIAVCAVLGGERG